MDELYTGYYTPVPTRHKGVTFRSKTEARWATFFHHSKVEYVYEPEKFSIRYFGQVCNDVPDFWLPKQNKYVEVKPYTDDYPLARYPDADAKATMLAAWTQQDVILLCGVPGYDSYVGMRFFHGCPGVPRPPERSRLTTAWVNAVYPDDGQHWCYCPYCGVVDFLFGGQIHRSSLHAEGCPLQVKESWCRTPDTGVLQDAADKAMIRFPFPDEKKALEEQPPSTVRRRAREFRRG